MPEFPAQAYASRGASGNAARRAGDIALAAGQASQQGAQLCTPMPATIDDPAIRYKSAKP